MQLPIIEPTSTSPARSPAVAEPHTLRGRYAVVSLGCPKNMVDTEQMLGRLEADGYQRVDDPTGADFVVVNTCGFIDRARAESYDAIDEMLRLKQAGKVKRVVVTGCLAERVGDRLRDDRPEIDGLVGVFGRDSITDVVAHLESRAEEQRTVFRPAPIRALSDDRRAAVTPRHFAYLKISEGCDRLCTFCAIPKMRGKHASKPIEQVVKEAELLAASGVREIVIVAQDTTYYGIDLYGEPRLIQLLRRLDQIDGIDWIRLMYFYPMYIDDPLIETIASAERVVPYIDMPLQHATDAMLRRMARRVNRADTERLLEKLRAKIPGLVLRTTLITGFPGETDKDFDQLMKFVGRWQFERLGVFTYSYEPDTPAARLPNQIDDAVKEQRQEALMLQQQQIAYRWAESQVSQSVDVILDGPLEGQPDVWIGRTPWDAPEIDPIVYVTGDGSGRLRQGSLVPCEVVMSQDYDLIAVAAGDPR